MFNLQAEVLEAVAERSSEQLNTAWDFVPVASRLFVFSSHAIGRRTYFFFDELDQHYLDFLASINGGEVTLYIGDQPTLTTWRSRDGHTVLPHMTAKIKAAVKSESVSQVAQVKDYLSIADYQGIIVGDQPTKFARGEANFLAYHSILTVLNQRGQTVAYLDTPIPEAAVLDGPRYALAGSAVIFLLLAVVSLIVVRHVARLYSEPISRLSEGISMVLESIAAQLPGEAATCAEPDIKNNLPIEINRLESSFRRLVLVVEAWQNAESSLQQSCMQLLNSAKMAGLGEMAGCVAHEINNPLSIIMSRSTHIQRMLAVSEPDIEKAQEFAKLIHGTSKRIAEIIRGLRFFTRSGESDPVADVALHQVIADTLPLCAERFRLAEVTIYLPERYPDLTFDGRGVQISQVLLNLLNNACDASATLSEKWVRLEILEAETSFEIRVVDSGRGIPESVRNRIMQPFFTTKPVGSGTGLGLSVSKRILEEHGGSLRLDESADHTTFVVYLPKTRERAPRVAA